VCVSVCVCVCVSIPALVNRHAKRTILYSHLLPLWIYRASQKRIDRYIGLNIKYPYSCHILIKLEFSRNNLKNIKIPNFMKIRPVEAVFFHVRGKADGHGETGSRFTQLCERDQKKLRPPDPTQCL
jgi:hypothetical protein